MAVPVLYRPQPQGPCCDPGCRQCNRGRGGGIDRRSVLGFFGVLAGAWLVGEHGGIPGVQQTQAVPAAPQKPPAPAPKPARPAPVTTEVLLQHPNLALDARARLDLEGRGDLAERGGKLDPVLLALLGHLLEFHTLSIVVFATGHTKNVAGTSNTSMHWTGQAMDINWLDSQKVNASHEGAYALVTALAKRGDVTNLGHPWPSHPANPQRGVFSDADHTGHLHIGVRT